MPENKPRNPLEEFELIKRLLTHAQEVTGVKDKIRVIPEPDEDGTAAIGYDRLTGELLLVYQIGLSRLLSANELEAIIAHELGHVFAGDTKITRTESDAEKREHEDAADMFAVKHGYGKASISAFRKMTPYVSKDDDGKTHPTIASRITAIQRVMAQGVSAQ